MKTITLFIICVVALALIFPWLWLWKTDNVSASSLSPTSYWLDDYNYSTLDSRWSWVREDETHWSLADNPGFMRITTQTGFIYGTSFYGPQKNILIADAPTGDFQITTKVTFTPTTWTQNAGILYYQDDSNYLNLVHLYDSGLWISFHKEFNGIAGYVFYPQQVPTSTLYLRIVKQNTTFTGYFSDDNNEWLQVGQHTISLTDPKVGVGACNGYSGVTEIPADFDFFQMVGGFYGFLPILIK